MEGSTAQMTTPSCISSIDEILRVTSGQKAVRCPNCKALLVEYLEGVAQFTCRHCKWRGVVSFTGNELVLVTVQKGKGRATLSQAGRYGGIHEI